ncbi:PhzF family phenazine biosynthesis protein [Arthrobacter sp. NA-172]|uniref:PhzF family phenazine biosynthesis protein n=1 Tax=Arthrobacter sp. NA-172 TaxID=3367524 RepID=UPI0037548C47
MRAFANSTNLSETTFLLTPTDPAADYRLRIFTPRTEFPFAGHPTLGSAHAWLENNGQPHSRNHLVQECGAGLVKIRRSGAELSFQAPPLTKSGPVEHAVLEGVIGGFGVGGRGKPNRHQRARRTLARKQKAFEHTQPRKLLRSTRDPSITCACLGVIVGHDTRCLPRTVARIYRTLADC